MHFALLPFLLLSSAVLPYLTTGLRAEHLVVPLVAVLAAVRARRIHFEGTASVAALGFSLIALGFSSVLSWETGLRADPMTGMVRLAMPMAMLAGFPYVMGHVSDPAVKACSVIVAVAVGISLFTIASVIWEPALQLMMLWVRVEDGSVWLAAMDIGRITGIFNQPLEAGIFYSVALCSTVYLAKHSDTSPLLLILFVVFIIVGGTLCLSKNFIVLGGIAALLLAVWIRLISPQLASVLIALLVVIAPILITRYNENYFESLESLYYEGGVLTAVSAGRYGLGESEVSRLFADVWGTEKWLLGRGLGSHTPLDNGYLEYFFQGGTLALAGYLLCLFFLGLYAWRNRIFSEGKLLLVLVLYVVGSSFGGPALSANRANVALLLLIAGCIAGIRAAREHMTSAAPAQASNLRAQRA